MSCRDKISFTGLEGIHHSGAISFIVGYAGGDFLENIWKVIAGKIKG
jgi:hypothetical protein